MKFHQHEIELAMRFNCIYCFQTLSIYSRPTSQVLKVDDKNLLFKVYADCKLCGAEYKAPIHLQMVKPPKFLPPQNSILINLVKSKLDSLSKNEREKFLKEIESL